MRIEILYRLIFLAAGGIFFALLTGIPEANAQNVVVLVNDEPITSGDVAQRIRWNARTNGFGDRMKAMLTGDAIKERFRQAMIAASPHSQAEAEQAAEKIKKQLLEDAKNRVLSDGGGTSRKAAIDSLVEDKLKLQAAKKLDIKVSDSEVEQVLAQRAGGAAEGKKPDLSEFYKQFETDGITRKTIQDIIRAQLAWRDVIRRQYGPRLASLFSAMPNTDEKPSESDIQFDVRVLRLSVSGSDQKAISQRIMEAENLKQKFTSCAQLPNEAKLVSDATVRSIDKAKLASFPKDVQPLIQKASEGQMTPPVLVGSAIESYAICRKGLAAKSAKAAAEQKPDVRQQEYERFSRRYLQDLKRSASIDYRGKTD
ncbi:MAG TPA: SurA N-terminal domain-containing protein [Geobacterales bacterium]|nr:SurA N-terminal domain-containing protein [Geobacterales bacterium]